MTTVTESAIWERLMSSFNDLNPTAARLILGIKFEENELARVNELSAKARQGTLNSNESAELDAYINVADILAIMQSKARLSLKNNGHSQ